MSRSHTRLWLLVGVGVLLLAWLASGDEAAISSPATDKAPRSRPLRGESGKVATITVTHPAADAASGPLINAKRAPWSGNIPDLFAVRSWHVPPPPPSLPPLAQPLPPDAPPLPFAFLGQYIEGDTRLILLRDGTRMLRVAVGDVIDTTYQVADMQGGQLRFVYLPLQVEQVLNTGLAQ